MSTKHRSKAITYNFQAFMTENTQPKQNKGTQIEHKSDNTNRSVARQKIQQTRPESRGKNSNVKSEHKNTQTDTKFTVLKAWHT